MAIGTLSLFDYGNAGIYLNTSTNPTAGPLAYCAGLIAGTLSGGGLPINTTTRYDGGSVMRKGIGRVGMLPTTMPMRRNQFRFP